MPKTVRRQPSGPWIFAIVCVVLIVVYLAIAATAVAEAIAAMALQVVVAVVATLSLCLAVSEKDEHERTGRDWLNIAVALISWALVVALLLLVAPASPKDFRTLVAVLGVSILVTAVFTVWEYDVVHCRSSAQQRWLAARMRRQGRREETRRQWERNVGFADEEPDGVS